MPDALVPARCDAVILAGGKATRLQSVVRDRPKILADICGQPFAYYLLNQLAGAGFRRAVICTGHLANMVEAALGTEWGAMKIVYSREKAALDTAGAVRQSLSCLAGDGAVVINGDTFLQIDFADFLRHYSTSGAAAALALTSVPDASRYGSVIVSDQGMVTGFVEKCAVAEGSGTINAGIYAVRHPLIAAIPPGRRTSIEREIMPEWVKSGMAAYITPGPFIDIGTPQSYALAQDVLGEWAGKPIRP